MIEPSVDLEELTRRVGGPDRVRHLAGIVSESWPEDFARFEECLRCQNGKDLRDAAHTLKGNLANLAAGPGRNLALELEQAALQLDWDKAARLIARLRTECQRIQRELESADGPEQPRLTYRVRATGRVLVVDDDPASRWMVAEALERHGHEVYRASCGEDALKLATTQHLEAILLDVVLPGLNGYEICRTLKSQPQTQTIPVLLITALHDRNNRLRGIQSGADEFLSKPLDVEELALRVGNAVYSKQLYDELQANFERLQSLEALRDQLSDMLVHDLRTPLTALIGYAQILTRCAAPRLDEMEKDSLSQMLSLSRTMVGMVSDILDVGRLESDELPLNRVRVELAELARESAALVGQVDGKTVEVEGTCAAEVDPELFGRVLTNLIANGIKYSPPGGVVRVVLSEPGEIRVIDRGPGVPEEMRERIFEKYGQADRKKYSTGLGLAFCKLVVEKHGGTLGVDGQVGHGSQFWVRL